ncbi:hypothetical protein EX30DRAFT_337371 [Ascodesmis nigricans]|uniref:Uncharacterized protein n=1 Tax=Ascodesmis nigricans TaxID=341454 RepID=A0A4S2N6L2_9PEZI|nr:hypothetical protein EX30DRAFT_337371 [Ascodesmis nigricans]
MTFSVEPLFAYDAETQLVTILSRDYTVRQVIRMVIVIFGYLLLRPLLLRMANKVQQKEHERQDRLAKEEAERELKEGKKINDEGEELIDEDVGTTGWGAGARRRVKAEEMKRKEAAEREAAEGDDGEDKELEGLLED